MPAKHLEDTSAMAPIRTVTGDIDPDAIRGVVASFTHLAPDWRPISDRDPEIDMPSETRLAAARAAGEKLHHVVASSARRGVGLIVDATPPGAGRDPMRLHDIAASTGMAIVACTGAHAPPVRLARVEDRSAEYLAEWFAFEIGNGMAAIAGDPFRGVPLMSERAAGVAGDALNDAAVRAGAIRITLASPTIDRVDGALIDAAAMTAGATGVATFLDAPSTTNLEAIATRFEGMGANRSRIVLAPGNRTPDALLAAASLGLAVIVTAPATTAEGAVAIWEGTVRGFLRHGLIDHLIATVSISGMSDGALIDHARPPGLSVLSHAIAGVDDVAMHAVATSNAVRVLGIIE